MHELSTWCGFLLLLQSYLLFNHILPNNQHTALATLASTLFLELTTLLLTEDFCTCSFLCLLHSIHGPHSEHHCFFYVFAYMSFSKEMHPLTTIMIYLLILLSLPSLYLFLLHILGVYSFIYYDNVNSIRAEALVYLLLFLSSPPGNPDQCVTQH